MGLDDILIVGGMVTTGIAIGMLILTRAEDRSDWQRTGSSSRPSRTQSTGSSAEPPR